MITGAITKVTLTRTTESSETDFTTLVGEERWLVEWVVSGRRKNTQLHQPHCSEKAARRHIDGLLKRRPTGVEVADVYTERIG